MSITAPRAASTILIASSTTRTGSISQAIACDAHAPPRLPRSEPPRRQTSPPADRSLAMALCGSALARGLLRQHSAFQGLTAPTTQCQKLFRQRGIATPGDIMSEHRATSSRKARATSSESAAASMWTMLSTCLLRAGAPDVALLSIGPSPLDTATAPWPRPSGRLPDCTRRPLAGNLGLCRSSATSASVYEGVCRVRVPDASPLAFARPISDRRRLSGVSGQR